MRMSSLAALALLGALNHSIPDPQFGIRPTAPTVSLSAIRRITCDEGSGSGFLIADNVVATAFHVANLSNCKDQVTGEALNTYHTEEDDDFALMTGNLPDMPYLKPSCQGYQARGVYHAYGVTGYWTGVPVFGAVTVIGTGGYMEVDFNNDDGGLKRAAILKGYTVSGQSGGPIIDVLTGAVPGMVNAGSVDMFGGLLGRALSLEFKDTVICNNN